ncbi:retrovirus-related pol polyprotein from transposon TNT 1-94 [Tanacetum coccineum]
MHMLTEPQVFYDNIHKQALGYQNPFYLKKAQRIKPTLYDGVVISAKHVAMLVIDDEETMILEEESRSKMSKKEKDPEAIKQNISHKHIDYEKLNRLSEDSGKDFTPQQELSAEQAFWLRISNPTIKSSNKPHVIVEVPSELPKVSLVNVSLKKLKFHLAQFDSVVKKRTTPDARTEGEWGFKHTKTVFNNEIIPFLKSLKDIINIMSQDVLVTMMNSMSLNGESLNMERKRNESCDKCFNLDAELLKSQNAHNDLLKSYSQLEKHCCPDCSLVSGLRMFETHDREPLSAHELSCALGKSKKTSHQPKAEDTNQEKLYLLHMDLCGPMRVASINGKRYILVIVDDYSRFTWVRFLRTKDEAPEAIIKCIKNIQVRLNAIVHNVRTNNETEFVNQILRELILD